MDKVYTLKNLITHVANTFIRTLISSIIICVVFTSYVHFRIQNIRADKVSAYKEAKIIESILSKQLVLNTESLSKTPIIIIDEETKEPVKILDKTPKTIKLSQENKENIKKLIFKKPIPSINFNNNFPEQNNIVEIEVPKYKDIPKSIFKLRRNNIEIINEHIRNNQYEDALIEINNIKDPQNKILYSTILSLLNNNYKEAEQSFATYNKLNEDKITKLNLQILMAFSKYKDSTDAPLIYLKALISEILINKEKNQLAEILLLNILKENKQYRDAWTLLGYLEIKDEEYLNAIKYYNQALKLEGNKDVNNFYIAIAYQKIKNNNLAMKHLEQAIAYNYTPIEHPLNLLLEIYLNNNKYQKAAYLIETQIEKEPTIEYYEKVHSIYLNKLRNYELSSKFANMCYEDFPDSHNCNSLIGQSLIAKKKYLRAKRYLQTAIKINPQHGESHFYLAEIYKHNMQDSQAKILYKKAFKLSNDEEIKLMAEKRLKDLTQK